MPSSTSSESRPRLIRYLAAASLARAATEATGPALLLVALAVLGSASIGSYLVASVTAASAIAGPIVGAHIDRSSRPKRTFTWSLILMALGVSGLALLIGRAPLPVLIAVAVLAGLGYPAITGAWSAQLHHVVPPQQIQRAFAADAGTYSVAAILGPPAAAALLFISPRAPLWLPVIALILALPVLRSVRLHPRQDDSPPRQSIARTLRAGLHAIIWRPALRANTIVSTVSFFGQAALFVALPVIVQQRTGSLAFTGIVLGALAAGGIGGSIIAIRRPVRRPDRAVTLTIIACGIAMASFAINLGLIGMLVAAFVFGAAEAVFMTSVFQIRNRESPVDVRAQVFTTSASLRLSAFALGSAAFGTMLAAGPAIVILVGVAMHLVALGAGVSAQHAAGATAVDRSPPRVES